VNTKRERLLAVLIAVFFSVGVLAAEPPRTVSVTGNCVRSVVPDRGALTLTVEVKDPDAKRAQTAASRQYDALRGKIAALKLKDGEISTSEYISEEIREWEHSKMVSKGFHTRIGLRVETADHARLGEVIEIASREEIKEVSELRLFVSTKKMLDEKMACLREASEQARAKAESLASALGAKVGEVQKIEENSTPDSPAPGPVPMYRGAMSAMAKVAAPTIDAGKTEISTAVQVTFGLK
jgi:uncharacterized protein YggE